MPASANAYARLLLLMLAMGGFAAIWNGDKQGVSHFPIARRAALAHGMADAVIAPVPSRIAPVKRTAGIVRTAPEKQIALDCFPKMESSQTTYRLIPNGERWSMLIIQEPQRIARIAPIRKPMSIIDFARTALRGAEYFAAGTAKR